MRSGTLAFLVLAASCSEFTQVATEDAGTGTIVDAGADAQGDGGAIFDPLIDGQCLRDNVVVGRNTTTDATDSVSPGYVDAYGFAYAGPTKHVECLWIYIDPSSMIASAVRVGVYAGSLVPGPRLAQANIPPGTGWQSAVLSKPLTIENGTTYWIGALAASSTDTLILRANKAATCGSSDLRQASDISRASGAPPHDLPDPFAVGQRGGACELRAYLSP